MLTLYEPYGVVAGILPWKLPVRKRRAQSLAAIAAGNPSF